VNGGPEGFGPEEAAGPLLAGLGLEAGPDPTVLVLGTFPSVLARRDGAYYANPRNQFWPIIEALFGIPRDAPYRDRVRALNERGVALWDTVDACRQVGSMDQTIRQPVLNDIVGYLEAHPTVRLVAVNGRTAERFLKRAMRGRTIPPGVRIEVLPSTSPAHAGMRPDQKARSWAVIAEYARLPLTLSSRS